jgi:hypothetical protein
MKTIKISNDWYRCDMRVKGKRVTLFGYSRHEVVTKARRLMRERKDDQQILSPV